MTSEDDRLAPIADAIERYLRAHPDAADTVEGIRLWWLRGNAADEAPERVRIALERLEAAGVVTRRKLPGGQVIYAAARRPR
jgi:hypothetical protein